MFHDRLNNNRHRTRQGASKPTPVQQIISKFMQLRKKNDAQIDDVFREFGENDPILKGITLAPQ